MVRRFRGEVDPAVASLAPQDSARVARRLAQYARSLAEPDMYGMVPIPLSQARGYLQIPAGAIVRAVG
eukprot:14892974-Alexandrium_andersonii.AAC.1